MCIPGANLFSVNHFPGPDGTFFGCGQQNIAVCTPTKTGYFLLVPIQGVKRIACSCLPNEKAPVSVSSCQKNTVGRESNLCDPLGVFFDFVKNFIGSQIENLDQLVGPSDCDQRLVSGNIRTENRVLFFTYGQHPASGFNIPSGYISTLSTATSGGNYQFSITTEIHRFNKSFFVGENTRDLQIFSVVKDYLFLASQGNQGRPGSCGHR